MRGTTATMAVPPLGSISPRICGPSDPRPYSKVYTAYFRTLSTLARTLMRLFAIALDQPETFFDAKIDKHISRLRVRNYPAPLIAPKPGQFRAGPHSDYGSLTILKTEDKPGGLQAYNKAGVWVDVPVMPGCFVVNLGELMARWTNDRWVSTLHRVVNPPEDVVPGVVVSRWCSSTIQTTTR